MDKEFPNGLMDNSGEIRCRCEVIYWNSEEKPTI